MAAAVERPPSFFLERMERLANTIGRPEREWQVIHVAGTSGKGSTTQMIYEALLVDGRSVGLYQSPYVTAATENIQINGQLVSADAFADAVDQIRPVVEQIRTESPEWTPSYAEIFFGVALIAFQDAGIEWLVVEAGCGGRFDKTNIIEAPVAVGLTQIGLDHREILGETEEEITHHKAGVIKSGAQVFTSEQRAHIRDIFQKEADRYNITITHSRSHISDNLILRGAHQYANAGLAGEICRAVGVNKTHIQRGLHHATLPARIEVMPSDNNSPMVVIDGAHSRPKLAALAHELSSWVHAKAVHLIVAPKEGKDLDALVTIMDPLAGRVTVTSWELPGFKSEPTQLVKQLFIEQYPGLVIDTIADPQEAMRSAIKNAHTDDLVIATGSLYMAGQMRELWFPEEDIVLQQTIFPNSDI